MDVEAADTEFEVLETLPIKSLAYNTPASTYIIVKLPDSVDVLTTSFDNTLRFVVKDVDAGPTDLGISDEYAVSTLIPCIIPCSWVRVCLHLH